MYAYDFRTETEAPTQSQCIGVIPIPSKMFDGRGEYSPSSSSSSYSAAVAEECLAEMNLVNTLSKKKKSKNKRRFSDDQIRLLETLFETETKLEPRKKLQLARELGLQPRQVAIWFQNKRARWKSKQLQRDFNVLQANYNTLTSQFDSLMKEKQSLLAQLQKLNDLVEKSHKDGQCCRQEPSGNCINNIDGASLSDKGGIIKSLEFDVKPSLLSERSEYGVAVLSDNDRSLKPTGYLGLDEEPPELVNLVEPRDGSLTSPDEWGSLESDGLLQDQPTGSCYQWWDFWC